MSKKIFSILAILFVVMIGLTQVYASESLFDFNTYMDIYKLSEQDSKIDLPFVYSFLNPVTFDEVVTHSGITIAESTVDVDEKLEGVHVIFASDMVTIKGEVENALIYGNNIVVEGKISGDTILMAPTVQIMENATVSKDVIIVANTLDIKGNIEGNVIATVSEKVTITGNIKEDVRMIATDVDITNANIEGDIYIETDTDSTSIKTKYPDAVIKTLTKEQKTDWMSIITKGIITVVIYGIICFVITRKDNNIATKAYIKFKSNTSYGLIMAFIMILLIVVIPIISIILAVVGLGIVSWPILTVYIALMVLVGQLASLIVGTVIFEAIKGKVKKFKIPVIALIFIVLYLLTKISFISLYANLAIYVIALAIVVTMITKKQTIQETQKTNK